MNYKPVVLIVLDGFGYSEKVEGNAIAQAQTPFFDELWKEYPHALLDASGNAVGLPEGQIGSSEVGHQIIGAGKILYQPLVRISKAAEAGELETNEAFIKIAKHVKQNHSVLHLAGLVSPGGVHSHQDHLHAIISAFKQLGVERIAIHVFTDGRDVYPESAHEYLEALEDYLEKEQVGVIASVSGRYYAMDRDGNFDRVKKAEDAIFHCQGNVCEFKKASELVKDLHIKGVGDEHVEPYVLSDREGKSIGVEKDDAIFFFNFRPDRARQLVARALERAKVLDLCVGTLAEYDPSFNCLVAFPPLSVETTLAKEVAKAGMTQVHIAETEKYSHATYFLNGGSEEKQTGEVHVLVESRKDIPTHDLAPEMQAKEITDKAIEAVEQGADFIFINYANADMVGHTGNLEATIKAVEVLDAELKRLVDAVHAKGGVCVITADHGNAEQVQHEGSKHTAHTTNPVPIFITKKIGHLNNGGLQDVAPTVLKLLEIAPSQGMSGKNLFG